MKANELINILEQELLQIQDNITRVREYAKENKDCPMFNSHVIGELKHRCVAIKSTLTRVCKLSTYQIINNK